jgi:hypothetical protein
VGIVVVCESNFTLPSAFFDVSSVDFSFTNLEKSSPLSAFSFTDFASFSSLNLNHGSLLPYTYTFVIKYKKMDIKINSFYD